VPFLSNRDIGTRQRAAVSTDEAGRHVALDPGERFSVEVGPDGAVTIHVTPPAEEAGGETDATGVAVVPLDLSSSREQRRFHAPRTRAAESRLWVEPRPDGTVRVGPSDPANIVIPVGLMDENEVEILEVRPAD
jgi:hypothetical protein